MICSLDMSTKGGRGLPCPKKYFHLFHLFVCRDHKTIYICTPFEKRNDGTSGGVLYKIAQRQAERWHAGHDLVSGQNKKHHFVKTWFSTRRKKL
jgi:hypothetical protein